MDLDFVENFNTLSVNWNPKFYIENGFNRWKQCGKSQTPGKDKYGSNGGDSMYQNSGNSGHGQCCGKSINSVIYKPERMECCPDGRVKQIGTCYWSFISPFFTFVNKIIVMTYVCLHSRGCGPNRIALAAICIQMNTKFDLIEI